MDDRAISVNQYAHGVLAIDSGLVRPRMTACYLLEDGDDLAFVETGSNHSVPQLLRVLEIRGWKREQVRWVIVTHVHLDHAGGTGALMQGLPDATLVVHPRGARHMIDPSKLEASARQVYGDAKFDAMYGHIIPVDENRVRIVGDGEQLHLGQRMLEFVDTPGHARHHFCVWDQLSQGWFTGDTFGISYPDLSTPGGRFIFPTTTPVQFDPEVMHQSVNLLLERKPRYMYLTHYGRVEQPAVLAGDLHTAIDDFVVMAEQAHPHEDAGPRLRRAMTEWLTRHVRALGCHLDDAALRECLSTDVDLNTKGLLYWMNNRD